jgi:hypothetical protein
LFIISGAGSIPNGWESFPELLLLKVKHGFLAEWNIFREEIVEVIVDPRVVNTSAKPECGKEKQCGEELAESSLRFGWRRWWRRRRA